MKLKIKEIKENEFKNKINKGKLNEEQIEKIQSNIKELGLMGSLPVYKKDGQYRLIGGHHRLEALKRQFGENYEIEVIVHNYNNDQVLRGMVVENLSQRIDDFKEELSNVLLIRDYLRKNNLAVHLVDTHNNPRPQNNPEAGSVRNIYEWLNQQGKEVMKKSKIANLIAIDEKLSPEIKEKIQKFKGNENQNEGVSIKVATALASIEDKQEQKEVLELIKDSEETLGWKQQEIIRSYRDADEETKELVKSGEIKIDDVAIKRKNEGLSEIEQTTVISKKIATLINDMRKLEGTLRILPKERRFHFKKQVFSLIDEAENQITKLKKLM